MRIRDDIQFSRYLHCMMRGTSRGVVKMQGDMQVCLLITHAILLSDQAACPAEMMCVSTRETELTAPIRERSPYAMQEREA